MRSKLLMFSALFAISFAIGCGGDLDQVSACKEGVAITCDKFHSCFPAAVKDLPEVKAVIGLNAADCKVKLQGSECTTDKARCDAGKSYHADKAEACLAGLRTLSCNDITSNPDNIPEPAACDQICS